MIGEVNEVIIDCCDLILVDFMVVDEFCVGEVDGSIIVVVECLGCVGLEYFFDGGEIFGFDVIVEGLMEDCYIVIICVIDLEDCQVECVLIVENDNLIVILQVEELSFNLEMMLNLVGVEIVIYIVDNIIVVVMSGDGLQLVDLIDFVNFMLIIMLMFLVEGFNFDEVLSIVYVNGILVVVVFNDDM